MSVVDLASRLLRLGILLNVVADVVGLKVVLVFEYEDIFVSGYYVLGHRVNAVIFIVNIFQYVLHLSFQFLLFHNLLLPIGLLFVQISDLLLPVVFLSDLVINYISLLLQVPDPA